MNNALSATINGVIRHLQLGWCDKLHRKIIPFIAQTIFSRAVAGFTNIDKNIVCVSEKFDCSGDVGKRRKRGVKIARFATGYSSETISNLPTSNLPAATLFRIL